ncbi:MAG: pantoate--beta-alanine ligase [candidate division Zixibacteria bacterium]|nr:pantoate--beta-alanine ligase [candidate division Zixibacteria bacterium]
MEIVTSPREMQTKAEEFRRKKLSLGLVPTMGYFHEGHLSLIRRARADCDVVVVSLFVNPTQFGAGEDFERYPRDIERDERLATAEGVDVMFAPEATDMYAEGYTTYVDVERLTEVLCGARRPGHFRGVATVVAKLLNICRPEVAYFGRKDYQQAQVIKRLAADLNYGVKIEVLPIVREADGLAMSSRNSYLSPEERRQATCLYRALARAQALFAEGERRPAKFLDEMAAVAKAEPAAEIDYIEIVHPLELTPVPKVEAGSVAALAAFINKTRLIDNTIIGEEDLKVGARPC